MELLIYSPGKVMMDWGSWTAEVLFGVFFVGWGILTRYMSTRHADVFDRMWPNRLREAAIRARSRRSQKLQMTVIFPALLVLMGAAVLIQALITLMR